MFIEHSQSLMIAFAFLIIACCASTVFLTQDDFNNGTYRIVSPGKYKLTEDIVFNPNPKTRNEPGAWMPEPAQNFGPQFSLGFFAAITVEAPNVILDLNGHTLSVSKAFYLQQRFHALISLSSAPFITGQGPSIFGDVVSATNCIIRNGKLGLTSHHGIHGNNVNGCKIKNLVIEDFEVGGISLNNASNIKMKNVTVQNSLRDVPVNGAYNAGRFMLMFLRQYNDSFLNGNSVTFARAENSVLTLRNIVDRLEAAMDLMFAHFVEDVSLDVVEVDPLWGEFVNENDGLPDGSALYGIVINGVGEAAGGLGTTEISSTNVTLKNVKVRNLVLAPVEVVKFFEKNGDTLIPAQGTTGNTFNIFAASKDFAEHPSTAQYEGTTLTDAQIALSIFTQPTDRLVPKTLSIPPSIRNWATIGTPIAPGSYELKCNGDDQFHVIKGAFGIRIDATNNFTISRSKISRIENQGDLGSTLCGPYNVSHPKQTLLGYRGGTVFGLSVFTSSGVLKRTRIKKIESLNGIANGIKIYNAKVDFKKKNNKVRFVKSDGDAEDSPNPDGTACGVCLGGSLNLVSGTRNTLTVECIEAHSLCSPSGNMLSFGKIKGCDSGDDDDGESNR